ncbi:MAG TPA: TraR/DksA C4-type zinc finger protein [Pseudomonadales bacterium]
MRENDLFLLISLIEQRIEALKSTIADHHSLSDKKKGQSGDTSANLDLMINSSVDESILAEHKLELAKLVKNISWLKSDNAGLCDQCGDDIPIDRLKAVLTTRQCVACASANN